jgi:hypothetical protein
MLNIQIYKINLNLQTSKQNILNTKLIIKHVAPTELKKTLHIIQDCDRIFLEIKFNFETYFI